MSALLFIHVLISLIGIAAGFVVMVGMLRSGRMRAMTAVFLLTTILTSVTGFPLPAERFLPSHAVGILSLITLALASVAYYPKRLRGHWRWIYVVTAIVSQYFNCFVGVVQAFEHIPALKSSAPTQTEPPFAIAQGIVLLFFIAWGIVAVRRFHPNTSVQPQMNADK
ncbi:MAG TPA: hypothetical protein VL282_15130 [Tepidisphaeraceae bacterium]|jgi:hypothetical protein|nr:hypothetical protein [Tepidisphaeraceae bacterium]